MRQGVCVHETVVLCCCRCGKLEHLVASSLEDWHQIMVVAATLCDVVGVAGEPSGRRRHSCSEDPLVSGFAQGDVLVVGSLLSICFKHLSRADY
jgi:hypothetical protein